MNWALVGFLRRLRSRLKWGRWCLGWVFGFWCDIAAILASRDNLAAGCASGTVRSGDMEDGLIMHYIIYVYMYVLYVYMYVCIHCLCVCICGCADMMYACMCMTTIHTVVTYIILYYIIFKIK